jgi:hypothetical protein
MRTFATALMAVAFLSWGAPAAAQNFGFGAHAGVSIPTGSYADDVDLGFSGGLDLFMPLTMVSPALSWYSSVDVAGHSVSASEIDGGFLTIPVMTGARFDVGAFGAIRPFATGQLGFGFLQAPDVGQDDRSTTAFGYALGGGLQLTQNVYSGVKWFNFGGEDVSYLDIYVGFGVR